MFDLCRKRCKKSQNHPCKSAKMMLIGSIVKSRNRKFMFQATYLVHCIQQPIPKLRIWMVTNILIIGNYACWQVWIFLWLFSLKVICYIAEILYNFRMNLNVHEYFDNWQLHMLTSLIFIVIFIKINLLYWRNLL